MKNDYRTVKNTVQQSLQFHTGKTQKAAFFISICAARGGMGDYNCIPGIIFKRRGLNKKASSMDFYCAYYIIWHLQVLFCRKR